ncbi:MAG TPA: alpha-L-fucosidase [Terriglobales bacterium]|nr:alpha-L-fucosidase [Terriglobales bacterium]
MRNRGTSRREYLKFMAASAGLATATPLAFSQAGQPKAERSSGPPPRHEQRIQWWQAAKFGMFIHWGLYSLIGRHEWAMEMEGIPVRQYEVLAKHFNPKPNAARDWARLAKAAGQKYMVMTTKHHEGFCNFDTKLTDYCAPKQAAGRDLVREFVEAARSEGLRVGFYYSLMDWHHPDGARCATDEAARGRFVAYTHGLIRELMTNYGKIDILWYDVDWPLTPEQWDSQRMNDMVFELQPDIIVNNRNGLPGDFSTPEQEIRAADRGRAWETCMTLNDSWGYHKADTNWKSAKTVVDNLITCAHGGGNYLLNIGPKPDGSIPEESSEILQAVGKWTNANGFAIYGTERCDLQWHVYAGFTQHGNTVYAHVNKWPGDTPAEQWLTFYQPPSVISFAGFRTKVKSVRTLVGDKPLTFAQDDLCLRITGLPASAPDEPATVIVIDCEATPIMDRDYVRRNRPRFKVGVS